MLLRQVGTCDEEWIGGHLLGRDVGSETGLEWKWRLCGHGDGGDMDVLMGRLCAQRVFKICRIGRRHVVQMDALDGVGSGRCCCFKDVLDVATELLDLV